MFFGDNAQGKTNALEAVWLLSTLKPLRGHRVRDLIAWDGEDAAVSCLVHGEDISRRLKVTLGPGGRRTEVDGRRSELQEYFAAIRAIAFVPADAAIVDSEPLNRRRWLDRAAFTRAPAHLTAVRRFSRCLQQKASALRQGASTGVLDALDEAFAQAGAELAERRQRTLLELAPHVSGVHRELAGRPVDVGLSYRTSAAGDGLAERTSALRVRLAESRPKEVERRRCLVGPQSDDVRFTLDGKPTRKFGSRGQVRSLVLALKLSELLAARERGEAPLFLLDDVSSELDRARTARLVALLADLRTQVFASTTAPEHMDGLPAQDTLRIRVRSGAFETD